MPETPPTSPPVADRRDVITGGIDPPGEKHIESPASLLSLDEEMNKRINAIEMIGEERAAHFRVPEQSQISPAMRFLHTSRNIHQMLIERTKAVTIYLAVASLLWTSSGLFFRADPNINGNVPMQRIREWCIPVTAGALTVMAVIIGFWLVRIRVGLIYEVAKMNVLLGEPSARVTRVNPLSISSLVQTLINLAGGGHAAILALYALPDFPWQPTCAVLIGAGVAVVLQIVYIVMIRVISASVLQTESAAPNH